MPPRKASTTPVKASSRTKVKAAASNVEQVATRDAPNWLLCVVQYSGILLSSLALSTALFSLSTQITRGDLAWTSKYYDHWWQVGGLLTWRAVELTVAWVLGYDARDVASFIFLTHLPTYVLLCSFYGTRPTTMLTVAFITIFSIAVPFCIFRAPSRVHQEHPISCTCSRICSRLCSRLCARTGTASTSTAAKGKTKQKPTILTDTPTTVYTTLVATAIYTVSLYTSFATWLPSCLVMHFDGLPDLRRAHEGPRGFVSLFTTLLPAGYALRDFLFVSCIGAASLDRQEAPKGRKHVERPGELLVTSLYRRYWLGLLTKTRVLASRTVVLATMIMLNTIVQVVGTISGAGLEGAVGWGIVWAVATAVTGVVFGWIAAADGL
ncbi:hypothetical protein PABG_02512 [Paracoccidioides brasiliensis Pb03]|uniref:Uncharacterized protein n=1 Tax=Paracoccidioides brasiliensis TaxID=121759 RepID=A0A1D2JNQ2_PARBR|nr:hypothetical protein PABG_02512 [Paracoccidioides brasiliensis Pb03]ODH44836.1 hypothetical protein ACO22_00666 [Paracoccidioides brasiliensis]ODH49385.1 hypothetical protein GX48_04470 [Paracoccidioides brasiliensis]